MDHTVLPEINTIPAVYLVSVHQMAPPPSSSKQLQWTALGKGCTPLLQCSGRLNCMVKNGISFWAE